MDKYKVNIILGFRESQAVSISADEIHKAYYLFQHPTERGVFDNGFAIRGQDIQRIEPDYHGTMGWNPSHKLDDDDWGEIRGRGIDRKMRTIMQAGKKISEMNNPQISKHLTDCLHLISEDSAFGEEVKLLTTKN